MPGGGPTTPPSGGGTNPHSTPVDPVEVSETPSKPDTEKPVDGGDAKDGE